MNRTPWMATVSLAMALSSVSALSSIAHAETVNIPVPKAALSTAFNAAFSSTKVRLHKDESYIVLPNGQKKLIDGIDDPVYVFKFDGIKRKLEYSLNDVNTHSIQATVIDNRIHADLHFENQGIDVYLHPSSCLP